MSKEEERGVRSMSTYSSASSSCSTCAYEAGPNGNGQGDELSGAEMGQLEHLGLGDSGGREFGSLDTYIEETLGVSQELELERMRYIQILSSRHQ